MRNIPVLVLGLTSVLMQIAALRQLLSVFSGNELVIGVTLAIWLIAVGAGSLIGRTGRESAFTVSFLAVGILVQPSILFMEHIPGLFFLEPGETISLTITLLAAFLCLFPLGLALGFQFPLSVSYLGNATRAYALEATGAFLGGVLFTFLLAGRLNSFVTASVLSALNLLIAAAISKRRLLILSVLFPLLIYFWAGTIKTNGSEREIVQSAESRYGRIMVFQDRDQVNVFASGAFRYSYPDLQTEEMKIHLPLSLHDSPSDVLVLGGSLAVIREVLKYPVAHVHFIEIDPAMNAVSLGLLSPGDRESMNDERVRIVSDDARRFIRSMSSPRYDMVIVNLPEPSTAGINRFYTVEFFEDVKKIMKPGAVLCLGLPASYGYIGRRMQFANGAVYLSLKKVFSNVAVSSEEYGGLYASDAPIDVRPQVLAKRFSARHVEAAYFYPLLFEDIFDPFKTNMVKARLESVSAVNTDMKPVAYLYNVMMWADMHTGKFLTSVLELDRSMILVAAAIGVLFIAILLWRRPQTVYYAMFSTGYSAMGLSIVIVLAFQAAYGYVYESIGLVTALFMAGLAAGAWFAARLREPLVWLIVLEFITIVVLAATPFFFRQEYLYYGLSLAAGMIAGAEFSAAARFLEKKEKTGATASILYGMDLAGSVAGALLTTVFSIPLVGVAKALLILIAIKVSSLALLFSLRFNHRVTPVT